MIHVEYDAFNIFAAFDIGFCRPESTFAFAEVLTVVIWYTKMTLWIVSILKCQSRAIFIYEDFLQLVHEADDGFQKQTRSFLFTGTLGIPWHVGLLLDPRPISDKSDKCPVITTAEELKTNLIEWLLLSFWMHEESINSCFTWNCSWKWKSSGKDWSKLLDHSLNANSFHCYCYCSIYCSCIVVPFIVLVLSFLLLFFFLFLCYCSFYHHSDVFSQCSVCFVLC